MEKSKLTVINLRGTSGSGKTSVVKNILSQNIWTPWIYDGKIFAYYDENSRWAVIGSYENACGGCDTIKTQNEVESRIEQFLNAGYNVVFEGLLISTLSSRWIKFSQKISDRANMLFYYLDTPIETCLERVKNRRISKGNVKPFNPTNTVERVKAIDTTYKKLSEAGCYCMKGSQEHILNNLKSWFGLGTGGINV